VMGWMDIDIVYFRLFARFPGEGENNGEGVGDKLRRRGERAGVGKLAGGALCGFWTREGSVCGRGVVE